MLSKNKLIKAVTSDQEIAELASHLNIKLNGILDIRSIKSSALARSLPSIGSYIILQRLDDNTGHWVAVHNNEYFDSMGIPAPPKLGIKKYNEIQYQGSRNTYCGIYCILWLYSKQFNKPELMDGFIDLDTDVILLK